MGCLSNGQSQPGRGTVRDLFAGRMECDACRDTRRPSIDPRTDKQRNGSGTISEILDHSRRDDESAEKNAIRRSDRTENSHRDSERDPERCTRDGSRLIRTSRT